MVGEEPAAKSESQLWNSVVKVAEATLECLEPYEGIENKHVNDVISAVRNLLDHGRDFELMKNYKPPTTASSQPAHHIRNQDYDSNHGSDSESRKKSESPAASPISPQVVDAEASFPTSKATQNMKHDDFNDYGSMSNFKFPTVDTTSLATSTSVCTLPFSASPAINTVSLSTSQPVRNKNKQKRSHQAPVYHNLEPHWQQPDECTVQVNLGEGRGTVTAIAITNEQQLSQAIQDMHQAKCIALNCEYLTQKKGGPPILKVLEIAVSKEKGFAIQVDFIGMQTVTDKLMPILENDQMTILAWSFRASAMAIEGYFKDIYLNDVYDLQALLQDVTGENLNLGAAVNRFASQWHGNDEFQRVKQQSRYQISFPGGKCVWDTIPLPPSALVHAVFKVLGLMALYESTTMYGTYEATKKYYWPHTIASVASPDVVQRWMKERAVAINWQRDVMERQQCEEEFNHHQEEQSSSVYSGNHSHHSNTKNEHAINNNIVDLIERSNKQELKEQHDVGQQVSNYQQHEYDEKTSSHHQKEQSSTYSVNYSCRNGTNEGAINNSITDSTEINNKQELKQQLYDIEQVPNHQQVKTSFGNINNHHANKSIHPKQQQFSIPTNQQAGKNHLWESSYIQAPNNAITQQQCDYNTETSTAAKWNAFAAQCDNNNNTTADSRIGELQPSFKEQQGMNAATSNLSGNNSPIDMSSLNNQQQKWSTGDVSSTRHINTGDAESTYNPSPPRTTKTATVGRASYYYTLLEQRKKC